MVDEYPTHKQINSHNVVSVNATETSMSYYTTSDTKEA